MNYIVITIIYFFIVEMLIEHISELLYNLHKRHRNKFRKTLAVIIEIVIIPYVLIEVVYLCTKYVVKSILAYRRRNKWSSKKRL